MQNDHQETEKGLLYNVIIFDILSMVCCTNNGHFVTGGIIQYFLVFCF